MHAKIHHLPSPAGVALTTVVPGGKAVEPMRKPGRPHRPQAVCHAHKNADSGSNNPKVMRVEMGAVTQHCAGNNLWLSVDEPHSLSIPPLCQVFPEGHTPVWLPSRQTIF